MSATTPGPRRPLPRLPLAAMLLASAAGLAGCAASTDRQESSGLFSPYRVDLPQGNYVTREMLDQVQPGMSRDQVRAALGSPLLAPVFQADRWDYVFRYQRPNREFEQRRVVIRFKDDRVAAIEAGELPQREDPNDPAMPGARAARKATKAPPAPPSAPAAAAQTGSSR
jgi:outer membrane protein assembly factor BamE